MIVHQLKIKKIKYINNKLYAFNNIDKDKLDKNSQFLLGSITKIFTAIGLLILEQEKKININHTFKKYINHKELANVKIIDVINHTSGIKREYDSRYDIKGAKKRYNNCIEYYNSYKKEKLIKHKKGTFNYLNLGYLLFGTLIQTITDITYKEFVNKNILKPLKMNNNGFDKTNTTLYNFNMNKLTKFQNNNRYNSISNAGLKSSISDLIKFKNFHKLLEYKSLLLFQKTYFFNYNKKDNIYKIQHTGGINGTVSNFMITYDNKWKVKEIKIQFTTN